MNKPYSVFEDAESAALQGWRDRDDYVTKQFSCFTLAYDNDDHGAYHGIMEAVRGDAEIMQKINEFLYPADFVIEMHEFASDAWDFSTLKEALVAGDEDICAQIMDKAIRRPELMRLIDEYENGTD